MYYVPQVDEEEHWWESKADTVGGVLSNPVISGTITFNGPIMASGIGDPNGQVTAVVGSIYYRQDGAPGLTLYIKELGIGATGWAPYVSAAGAQQLATAAAAALPTPTTVGGLAPCSAGMEGARASVTDALNPAPLTALVGGGSVHVPAYCNATGWIVP